MCCVTELQGPCIFRPLYPLLNYSEVLKLYPTGITVSVCLSVHVSGFCQDDYRAAPSLVWCASAGVRTSCEKVALLSSRSGSQQSSKLYWMFVWMIWTVQVFVTWVGIVIHHHRNKSLVWKNNFTIFQDQCHVEGWENQKFNFFWHTYWTSDTRATTLLSLLLHHQVPVSCEKDWIAVVKATVKV